MNGMNMTIEPFKWKPLQDIPDIKQVNTEQGRYYVLEDDERVKFYSITTILSDEPEKKKKINEWRKKVGEENANKKTTYSANRGTKIHHLFEKFLSNEVIDKETLMPHILKLFNNSSGLLQENISAIYKLEQKLFSKKLQIAGTVDGIVEWKGIPSILDFKTSGKLKRKEWIKDYFIQCTAYSWMLKEITGFDITQIVVFIATEEKNHPQIFIENVNNFKPYLIKTIYEYYERNGLPFPKSFNTRCH